MTSASGSSPEEPVPGARGAAPLAVSARGFGWRHPGRTAFRPSGVDLEIPVGQRVLLVGPSGGGKSTLLHAMAGLLDAQEPLPGGRTDPPDAEERAQAQAAGELTVGGRMPGPEDAAAGLLQQDPEAAIVLASVGDDVVFGPENLALPPEQIAHGTRRALEDAGLGALDPERSTAALSGGQLQRLGLAGIVAMRPGLLLLDEPTANLDPQGALDVRDAVIRAVDSTGATLVVVEHRTGIWRDAVDRVVVLGEHGVSADGTPSEIFDDGSRSRGLQEQGVWLPEPQDPRPAPGAAAQRSTGPVLLEARDLRVSRDQPAPGAVARRRRRVRAGRPVPQGVRGGRPAAEPLELTLRAGEAVALTGPNGAGKSTLALTLAGLLVPSSGTVRAAPELAGDAPEDPSAWSGGQLVARIGTVFQDPEHQFLRSSVRAELAEGPRRAGVPEEQVRRRVEELLDRLGLRAVAEANPFTLSGGQKRRLSVGTVLSAAPRVLLLDEPTFGQDAVTWRAVVELLREQRDQGRCVVVVTHDRELIRALEAREVPVRPAAEPEPTTSGGADPAGRDLVGGPLARRDGVAKAAAALALSLVLLVSADPVTSGIILAGELIALGAAGQRPLVLLRRAWPLLLGAGLTGWGTAVLAPDSGRMLLQVGPAGLSTGALAVGGALALRALAMALPGLLLVLTTDPSQLATGLSRSVRLPVRWAFAAVIGLRLAAGMIAQWQVLVTARRARGAGGSRHPAQAVRELGGRVFGLLVHALRRAGRLSTTLQVRGFDRVRTAADRTWMRPRRVTAADRLLVLGAVVLALAAPAVSMALGTFRLIGQ